MGFNGERKHQKIEDPRFLYWCDRKGLLVWSEMAATYEYSDEAVRSFTQEWADIVCQHYNHPCIVTWFPFNESWEFPKYLRTGNSRHLRRRFII
jgi:beta-galactosidase/beta-glucuronidase